jgi:hypothetical protein
MAIAELVEDLSIYPRHCVDDAHIRNLVLALEAGNDLPPLVADDQQHILVDGWHRARAHTRVHGKGATCGVILRRYKDRTAMIEDAVNLNICHGKKLDEMDRVRVVRMLENAGVNVQRIAIVMRIPEPRVQKLKLRVTAASGRPVNATVPGTREITLKASVRHLQGRTLTHEQAVACDSMPGGSFLLLVRQLKTAIEVKLVNTSDGPLMEALRDLGQVIQREL